MKAKERKTKLIMFFMCSLLLTAFLSLMPFCTADDVPPGFNIIV
jgi:hypothetical protein